MINPDSVYSVTLLKVILSFQTQLVVTVLRVTILTSILVHRPVFWVTLLTADWQYCKELFDTSSISW